MAPSPAPPRSASTTPQNHSYGNCPRTPSSSNKHKVVSLVSRFTSPSQVLPPLPSNPTDHPVEVVGRIREHPDGPDKPSVLQVLNNGQTARVKTEQGYRDFCLDGVSLAAAEDMQSFYKKYVESRIETVKLGGRCTIMMYGPTGAGKSHTMFGSPKEPGIAYRALQNILSNVSSSPAKKDTKLATGSPDYSMKKTRVTVSVLEVYNEEIYDLLASGPSTPNGHWTKPNLCRVRVEVMGKKAKNAVIIPGTDAEKISKEIAKVEKRRTVKSTLCNDRSSRSHCIVMIDVPSLGGRLVLVDMAGSENLEQAGLGTESKFQTGKINQGNVALKRVVEAIANGDSYIPFRDSKLTMLLQDSFEDDGAKILMILCASPDNRDIHKTIGTLEYGSKAKCIVRLPVSPAKDKLSSNDRNDPSVFEARIRAMDAHISKLEAENSNKEREKEEAHKELLRKGQDLKDLKQKLEQMEQQREKCELVSDLDNDEPRRHLERRLEECQKAAEQLIELEQKRLEEKKRLEDEVMEQQKQIDFMRSRLEEIEREVVQLCQTNHPVVVDTFAAPCSNNKINGERSCSSKVFTTTLGNDLTRCAEINEPPPDIGELVERPFAARELQLNDNVFLRHQDIYNNLEDKLPQNQEEFDSVASHQQLHVVRSSPSTPVKNPDMPHLSVLIVDDNLSTLSSNTDTSSVVSSQLLSDNDEPRPSKVTMEDSKAGSCPVDNTVEDGLAYEGTGWLPIIPEESEGEEEMMADDDTAVQSTCKPEEGSLVHSSQLHTMAHTSDRSFFSITEEEKENVARIDCIHQGPLDCMNKGNDGDKVNPKSANSSTSRKSCIDNIFLLCGNYRELAAHNQRFPSEPGRANDNGGDEDMSIVMDDPIVERLQVNNSNEGVVKGSPSALKASPTTKTLLSSKFSKWNMETSPARGFSTKSVIPVSENIPPQGIFSSSPTVSSGFNIQNSKLSKEQLSFSPIPLLIKGHEEQDGDSCEVYLKWETSKDSTGKLIGIFKIKKNSTLAEFRKELDGTPDIKHDFTFLMLGDPSGAPVERERETNLSVGSLPDCHKQRGSKLACLRPQPRRSLTSGAVGPLTPLENQMGWNPANQILLSQKGFPTLKSSVLAEKCGSSPLNEKANNNQRLSFPMISQVKGLRL